MNQLFIKKHAIPRARAGARRALCARVEYSTEEWGFFRLPPRARTRRVFILVLNRMTTSQISERHHKS